MIALQHPVWLVLALPLAALWLTWPLPTRSLRLLRLTGLSLVLLGLCQPAVRLPSRAGTLVVVADRSDSMPLDALSRELEVIRALHDSMPTGNRLGVVSFGRRAVVEFPPQQREFPGFVHEVAPDQSGLSDGLEAAMAVLPTDANGRVLVVSDGQWTGRDPLPVAARAAGRALGVDYRLLRRPGVSDVSIERVSAPQSVTPGQSFMISSWVRVPVEGSVSYRLERGGGGDCIGHAGTGLRLQ